MFNVKTVDNHDNVDIWCDYECMYIYCEYGQLTKGACICIDFD